MGSRIKMHRRNLMLCGAYPFERVPALCGAMPWATLEDMLAGKRIGR